MNIPNVFDKAEVAKLEARIDQLTPESQPQWGKMDSAQMFAHLNVAYDHGSGQKEVKYSGFAKLMMKLFVKKIVTSEKPYKRNSRTAPDFLIADERVFEDEKALLKKNMEWVLEQGEKHFEGKASVAFGALSINEWNNLFGKHLEHHLQQFGV